MNEQIFLTYQVNNGTPLDCSGSSPSMLLPNQMKAHLRFIVPPIPFQLINQCACSSRKKFQVARAGERPWPNHHYNHRYCVNLGVAIREFLPFFRRVEKVRDQVARRRGNDDDDDGS